MNAPQIIRSGKFVAISRDNFALTFRVQRLMPNGEARLITFVGAMPVLITQWEGSGVPAHIQSLN